MVRSFIMRRPTVAAIAVVSFAAFMAAALLFVGAASAANGDNVRTIIADRTGTNCASFNAEGDHSSVGVGIAFDGTNLLISCYSDNTITEIDPADGSQIAVHTISGATSLGALAYQATGGVLWGCSNFGDVGTIDLTTNAFTTVFSTAAVGGTGCFDGLAYDGVDNTIWASGDVSGTVEHYTTAGTLISSNPVSLGGFGNSGIAVGGPKLYLANNGGSQIYEATKDFASVTLFATFARRLEDLECDPVTFATSDGKGAIWSIDAFDNILNAWEIPLGQCGLGGEPDPGPTPTPEPEDAERMTGGGTIADPTINVRHGFELHCDATEVPNRLEVNWGRGDNFHLEVLVSAACTDDPTIGENPPVAGFDTHEGSGTGRYNGVPGATAKWVFVDAGEPGRNDIAKLVITDAGGNTVLAVSGNLRNGNHQAHRA